MTVLAGAGASDLARDEGPLDVGIAMHLHGAEARRAEVTAEAGVDVERRVQRERELIAAGHRVHHVHDPGPPATPLQAGNVITIEPGIYIPDEGIGVRIEDMLLVTETGSKLLTAALPSDPEAIEQALHARKR